MKTLFAYGETRANVIYYCELAELSMNVILFVLYSVTFSLNLIKKYYRKIALFTIRLFTIFTLVDMIIYILVYKQAEIGGIQYIAFENISLIIVSYAMDVTVRRISDK
jgi:hypothetical protein